MNTNDVVSLISLIRMKASSLLENELKNQGIEGLITSHGSILFALFKNGGRLKMKEIADRINRDKSTVTYLVNGLAKAGYVIREKGDEDSRETYIVLTQKAWDIERKFDMISSDLIATVYQGFTEEEKLHLLRLLNRVNDNLD